MGWSFCFPGTRKDLSAIRVDAEGNILNPLVGPQADALLDRARVLDERQRRKTQHRTAAEKARQHTLYNWTG